MKSGEHRRLLPALIKLVQTKPETPNPAVADTLTTILLSDESAAIRVNAAWALETWGTKESLPALQKAADDPNSGVSHHAKKAVERINAGE